MANRAYPALAENKLKTLVFGGTDEFVCPAGTQINGIFSDGGTVMGVSRTGGGDFVKSGTYASGTGWTLLGCLEIALTSVKVTSGSVQVFYTEANDGQM